jgi:hypothetical protein
MIYKEQSKVSEHPVQSIIRVLKFRIISSVVDSVADPGCLSRIRLFLVIPDPTKKERCKMNFFLPDQMITVVNVNTKYNFSSFSIFLK